MIAKYWYALNIYISQISAFNTHMQNTSNETALLTG